MKKKSIGILLAAVLMFSVVLTACGSTEGEKTFTVTFDSCGGSAVAAMENVKADSKITAPNPPIRENYKFMGWYIDKNYNAEFKFDTMLIIADTTLYARWGEVPQNEDGFFEALHATVAKPNLKMEMRFAGSSPQDDDNICLVSNIENRNTENVYYQHQLFNGDTLVNSYYFYNGQRYSVESSGDIKIIESTLEKTLAFIGGECGINALNGFEELLGDCEIVLGTDGYYEANLEPYLKKKAKVQGGMITEIKSISEDETITVTYSTITDTQRPLIDEASLFTLTLVYNNGINKNEAVKASFGVFYYIETPVKDGYNFKGWYENSDFSGDAVTNVYTITKNVTLYAKWEEKVLITPKQELEAIIAETLKQSQIKSLNTAVEEINVTTTLSNRRVNGDDIYQSVEMVSKDNNVLCKEETLVYSNGYTYSINDRKNFKEQMTYREYQSLGDGVCGIYVLHNLKDVLDAIEVKKEDANTFTVVDRTNEITVKVEDGKISQITNEFVHTPGSAPVTMNITYSFTADAILDLSGIEFANTYVITCSTPTKNYTVKGIDGDEVFLPTVIKEGLDFDGWYENSDYTGAKLSGAITITKNLTLYGRFLDLAFYKKELLSIIQSTLNAPQLKSIVETTEPLYTALTYTNRSGIEGVDRYHSYKEVTTSQQEGTKEKGKVYDGGYAYVISSERNYNAL